MPDPLKSLMLPLPRVTSLDIKSMTDSLNITMIGIEVLFVGDNSVVVMAAVGDVRS